MPSRIAKYALAPVLIAQGLGVRGRAIILPEPPGPRAGAAGTGRALRLLIAGDSSAAGVGAPSQEAALSGQMVHHLAQSFHVTWQLEATTGHTTTDCLRHLRTLPPQTHFDVAVLALGVNDITHGTTLRTWLRRQHQLHSLLRGRFRVRHIYAPGVPPMGNFTAFKPPLSWVMGGEATRFDAALARMTAQRSDLTHLPFDVKFDAAMMAEDGFHPNPAAYAVLGKILADKIHVDFA